MSHATSKSETTWRGPAGQSTWYGSARREIPKHCLAAFSDYYQQGVAVRSEPISAKMARLARAPGARPRVLDLFSGCGGLSLGFLAAGCEIVAAADIDELAAKSHALNFFKNKSDAIVQHHSVPRDIRSIE